MPFIEMGNARREPVHLGKNRGRVEENCEFEYGSVESECVCDIKVKMSSWQLDLLGPVGRRPRPVIEICD